MTEDDIISMARKAADQAPREDWNTTAWVFGEDALHRFAALVAAAEREACAQMVERMGMKGYGTLAIAGAIRVRREG